MPTWTRLKIDSAGDVTVITFNDPGIREEGQIKEIAQQLDNLVAGKQHTKVVLDLSHVQFLSSAGLGCLAQLRQAGRWNKSRVVICGMRKEITQVFKFAHFEKLFDLYETRDQAVASFGSAPPGA